MQVVYYVTTLVPSMESDTQFNKKQQYIGNKYVDISSKSFTAAGSQGDLSQVNVNLPLRFNPDSKFQFAG